MLDEHNADPPVNAEDASVFSSFSTGIRSATIYSGGLVTSYIIGPTISYTVTPIINNLSTTAMIATGAAIVTLPVSYPTMLVMAVSARIIAPIALSYPIRQVQEHSAAAGENVTETAIDSTKYAFTVLYDNATAATSNMMSYLTPTVAKPTDQKEENDGFLLLEIDSDLEDSIESAEMQVEMPQYKYGS